MPDETDDPILAYVGMFMVLCADCRGCRPDRTDLTPMRVSEAEDMWGPNAEDYERYDDEDYERGDPVRCECEGCHRILWPPAAAEADARARARRDCGRQAHKFSDELEFLERWIASRKRHRSGHEQH